MERDQKKLAAGIRAGAAAAGRMFASQPVDVIWQPSAYALDHG
jgi:hypothetical protein